MGPDRRVMQTLVALAFGVAAVAAPTAALAQSTATPPTDPKAAAEWHVERGVARYRGVAGVSRPGEEGAIADFSEAIRLDPVNTGAYMLRGERLAALERYDDALKDYNRAAALVPTEETFAQRARVHEQLEHTELAIADWDRAAMMAPHNAEYQNSRCWLRAVANKELDVARTACDAALAILPDYDSSGTLDSRALVSLRQGRFQDAWNDYDAALKIAGEDAGFLYGRGVAALRLGRMVEGRTDLRAAAALDGEVSATYEEMGVQP